MQMVLRPRVHLSDHPLQCFYRDCCADDEFWQSEWGSSAAVPYHDHHHRRCENVGQWSRDRRSLVRYKPRRLRRSVLHLWIFAPITVVLPAISGMIFVKKLNPFRSLDVNDVEEGFGIPQGDTKCHTQDEKQSLLQAEKQVSMSNHASDSVA